MCMGETWVSTGRMECLVLQLPSDKTVMLNQCYGIYLSRSLYAFDKA